MTNKRKRLPPPVRLSENEPLQCWFQDRDGSLYSVARLLDDARDEPVFDVPLASLDLSGRPWDGCDMLALAKHVQQCMEADLRYPILLAWDGSIADGRHRVLKAIALGRRTIKAKRLQWKPEADRPGSKENTEP